MANSSSPSSVAIRSYQVGFGDCFLLTFLYPDKKRYVLVDFGTNGTPEGNDREQLLKIAQDIQHQCGAKLHVVVATHRHKDHISGFSTTGTESPGRIIADCHPDIVIQPWTEDPDAKTNAQEATQGRVENFTTTLTSMQGFAGRAFAETRHLRRFSSPALGQLSFAGQNNLPNLSAVQNLRKMAKTRFYVNCGFALDLREVLPGVNIWVLGPPTLKQSDRIKKETRSDPDEFWLQQANFWKLATRAHSDGRPLFRNAIVGRRFPLATRWFAGRAAQVRTDELFELVRILDKEMNNTSLILLMEFNGKRLLLPGDAQIENWSYALQQPKYTDLLQGVNLYKVGHHGSRNATPKSLWKLFQNKSPRPSPLRLKTVVSTMAGKYGKNPETEVPRSTLVSELKDESDFFTTQELTKGVFYYDVSI